MHRYNKPFKLFGLFLTGSVLACSGSGEEYIQVPEGDYVLGQEGHPLNPRRTVHLEAFRLCSHEVTNAEFLEFVEATGYVTTAEELGNAMNFRVGLGEYEWFEDSTANWRHPFGTKAAGIEGKENHPVTCISILDALAYCQWKKVRLPSLDEWEAACRSGDTSRYFWGTDPGLVETYGNIWINPDHRDTPVHDPHLFTCAVKQYAPNPWGFYDMYGNVFEFCSGLPPYLEGQAQLAAARGGSWWCSKNSCNYFNSADIGRVNRYASFPNHGFRTVLP